MEKLIKKLWVMEGISSEAWLQICVMPRYDATLLEFCNENAEIFQSKYQRLAGSFNRVFSKEKQMFSKKKQVLH